MLDQEDNAYFTKLAQIIQLKGWGRLTKKDILKDCPEQLRDFAVVTPPKQALWKYLFWLVDKNLEHISQGVSTKVSVHDILLEGVMTIFDTIQPYKAFLRLAFFSGTTQSISYELLKQLDDRCQAILESAEISTSGLKGAVRVKVMQLFVAAAAYVWLEDDSEDQAKTMSFIDQKLRQVADFAGYFGL